MQFKKRPSKSLQKIITHVKPPLTCSAKPFRFLVFCHEQIIMYSANIDAVLLNTFAR